VAKTKAPKATAPEPRTSAMLLRLSAEERQRFGAAADASGVDLTTWIRLQLRRCAGMPTP
jgi:hypothetical protein